MRATKAYIAGLGTTGVLLAASLILLALVGTLVGFNAWPKGDLADRVERVSVDDSSLSLAGPDSVAAAAAVAADGVAAVAAGGGGADGAPGAADPGAPGVLGDIETGGPAPGPLPGGPPAPGPAGDDPDEPPLDPRNPESVTNALAEGTQRASGEAGSTVGPLSPELGRAVTDTGESAAALVRGLPLPNAGR